MRERSDERLREERDRAAMKYTAERLAAMLTPLKENADLNRLIEEGVFGGARDAQQRRERLRASGFKAEDLIGYGKDTLRDIEEIERIGVGDTNEKQKLEHLTGLLKSTFPDHKPGTDEEFFQLGLRREITRLLRKWILAAIEREESRQEDVLFNTVDPLLYETKIEQYLQMRQQDSAMLAARERAMLDLADDEEVKKRLAFIRSLAEKIEDYVST